MNYLNLIFLCFVFLLQSCKKEKENYMELTKANKTTTKATYKKGKLISSEVFNEHGELDSKYLYDQGVVVKIYQYYPDKKMNSYSYLHKSPNHYTTTVYYKNGKILSEGEGDYFKDKNLYLRRGPWIFYSKSGEPYSIYTFTHDKKKEYIKGEILFDTVKKKTIKDVIYDPPVLYEKE
ncbi:hypothetical protein [Chryseobacterium sp. CT-SW4]|uniref:hypothetical protein n=1 Tax=Chryseobacterium sp. SW-1 TaxID=3157343 RepID=UPI003B01679C